MNIEKEFIKQLTHFGFGVEMLTAVLSTIYWSKYKHIPILKYLPYFLWYMFLNEMFHVFMRIVLDIDSLINYNIYSFVNFTYFLALYRYYLQNRITKKIIFTFIILYSIIHIADIFYENYDTELQTFPRIVATLFLLIAIVLYFVQIINTTKLYFAKKDLMFWISLGTLFYYLGNTPFKITWNYYYQSWSKSYFMLLTNHCLAILMYICFSIGFMYSGKNPSPKEE